tara:strand:- start:182 stop:580 length:399 start_codon:yes stop_codon:yes gene_type:complete
MAPSYQNGFPVINKRNIERLLRKINAFEDLNISESRFNDGVVAVDIHISHHPEGPLSPEGGGDNWLGDLGFYFDFNAQKDIEFGSQEPYCFFDHRGSTYLAYKDNGYYDGASRIHVKWKRKLSKGEGLIISK